jgi:hypothetical protein
MGQSQKPRLAPGLLYQVIVGTTPTVGLRAIAPGDLVAPEDPVGELAGDRSKTVTLWMVSDFVAPP